jgi:hypothetical protein
MSDKEKNKKECGPEHEEKEEGWLDRVEDRLEAIGKAVVGEYDELQDEDEEAEHCEPPPAPHKKPPRPQRPPDVHVHVNVDCCCPPKKGGGDDGGWGKPPGKGRPGLHPSAPIKQTPPIIKRSDAIPAIIGAITDVTGGVWHGTREENYFPYLFIRANAGDTGRRPVVGHFWESPDIFIEPGVPPDDAPDVPAALGGIAKANDDNTVYAHIWNLGLAPAYDVLVEFFWFNPSLAFAIKEENKIGHRWVDLGGRGSARAHRVVKCPKSWRATYLNGGHECLVVRISQSVVDPLGTPELDASLNRHVGQRNIHVMSAAEAAAKPTLGVEVGPLFGQAATLHVQRADPTNMPWLHLVTMDRNKTFDKGNAGGVMGITTPTNAGATIPDLGAVPDPHGAGLIAGQQTVAGDDQQVGFHTNDAPPAPGQAHVYRIRGVQGGQTFGGYTVVILG